jgi:hypothetical protein
VSNAVSKGQDPVVVRNHDRRPGRPDCDALQQQHRSMSSASIERCRRLIADNERWPMNQGAGYCHPLLLADRELAGYSRLHRVTAGRPPRSPRRIPDAIATKQQKHILCLLYKIYLCHGAILKSTRNLHGFTVLPAAATFEEAAVVNAIGKK